MTFTIDANVPVPTMRERPDHAGSKTGTIAKLEPKHSVFFPGGSNVSGLIRNVKAKFPDRDFTARRVVEEHDDPNAEGEFNEKNPRPKIKMEGSRVWRTK